MDLTGCVVKAQIRPAENSPRLTAAFDVDVEPAAGHVQLVLESEITAGILPGIYVWDMKLTNADGEDMYYIYGRVVVTGRVTL